MSSRADLSRHQNSSTEGEGDRGGTFNALKHRNYRLFYFGQGISLSGTWMQTIAQAWLVLELTDSRVALGTVTLLQFLPITLFVLIAGVIADRVPKRSFLLATQVLAMAQAVILTVLVLTGQVELWHVYILAFVLGLSLAFEQPTRQAFVIEMVGRDDLLNAVTLSSGLMNGARLVGPAIGGVIIGIAGVGAAFLINAISFVPVIGALLLMRTSDLHPVRGRTVSMTALGELAEGFSYVIRTPACLMILIIVAVIGTFGFNFHVMLPLLARYVLETGSEGLGFLTAAVGLGAVGAATFLAGRRKPSIRTLFIGSIGFAVLLGLLAISTNIFVSFFFLLLLGISNIAFATTANTFLQIAAPDHLRGRVMSFYMLLIAGSTPIGGYLTGFMAEHLGTQAAIGILGAACGGGVLIGGLYYLTHRHEIERTADAAQLAAAAASGGPAA